MAICGFCGTRADPEDPDGPAPLTWTSSVERGRERVYCDTCSREHLRSIEAKLSDEYW